MALQGLDSTGLDSASGDEVKDNTQHRLTAKRFRGFVDGKHSETLIGNSPVSVNSFARLVDDQEKRTHDEFQSPTDDEPYGVLVKLPQGERHRDHHDYTEMSSSLRSWVE